MWSKERLLNPLPANPCIYPINVKNIFSGFSKCSLNAHDSLATNLGQRKIKGVEYNLKEKVNVMIKYFVMLV